LIKGSPYSNFVGRDSTLGFATNTVFDFPNDDGKVQPEESLKVDNLNESQQKSLSEWIALFERKYQIVGYLK
jgi:hypothetical protein